MNSTAEKRIEKDLPDVETARRIAAGDRDALRQLMRRYNQTLYRTARSILKDDAEAEDAVQEAYIAGVPRNGWFCAAMRSCRPGWCVLL